MSLTFIFHHFSLTVPSQLITSTVLIAVTLLFLLVHSSAAFEKLCPLGPGRSESGADLNECEIMPGSCEGGDCINTDGSFRCECPMGYVLDSSGRRCIGEFGITCMLPYYLHISTAQTMKLTLIQWSTFFFLQDIY